MTVYQFVRLSLLGLLTPGFYLDPEGGTLYLKGFRTLWTSETGVCANQTFRPQIPS